MAADKSGLARKNGLEMSFSGFAVRLMGEANPNRRIFMPLFITSITALALVPIFFVLFVRVSKARSRGNVSIGDGGDVMLLLQIRRHGNFIEWVPFVLIVMALAEMRGGAVMWLTAAGAVFVAGRVLHPIGLDPARPAAALRIIGNSCGFIALIINVVLIAMSLV